MGFWVSMRPLPSWRPSESFRWIQEGVSVCYLHCLVGINMHKERLLAPLMLSLTKKLLIWDTTELALVGRVMIANQDLLCGILHLHVCSLDLVCCIFNE